MAKAAGCAESALSPRRISTSRPHPRMPSVLTNDDRLVEIDPSLVPLFTAIPWGPCSAAGTQAGPPISVAVSSHMLELVRRFALKAKSLDQDASEHHQYVALYCSDHTAYLLHIIDAASVLGYSALFDEARRALLKAILNAPPASIVSSLIEYAGVPVAVFADRKCHMCEIELGAVGASIHHCRSCGGAFCGTCSGFRTSLPPAVASAVDARIGITTMGQMLRGLSDLVAGKGYDVHRVCYLCFYRRTSAEGKVAERAFAACQYAIAHLIHIAQIHPTWASFVEPTIRAFSSHQYRTLLSPPLSSNDAAQLWESRLYLIGHNRLIVQLASASDLSTSSNVAALLDVIRATSRHYLCSSLYCSATICKAQLTPGDIFEMLAGGVQGDSSRSVGGTPLFRPLGHYC